MGWKVGGWDGMGGWEYGNDGMGWEGMGGWEVEGRWGMGECVVESGLMRRKEGDEMVVIRGGVWMMRMILMIKIRRLGTK